MSFWFAKPRWLMRRSISSSACWLSAFLLLREYLLRSSTHTHFFIRLFVLLVLRHRSPMYIFDINPLQEKSLMNIFSHTVGWLFVLLMVLCAVLKLLVRCSPTCSFFKFCFPYLWCVQKEKKLFLLMFKSFLFIFSWKSFVDQCHHLVL